MQMIAIQSFNDSKWIKESQLKWVESVEFVGGSFETCEILKSFSL